MHWLYYAVLIVLLVVGFSLNVMSLPGLWVMVASLVGYALVTGWGVYVGWPGVIAAVVLAGIGEVLETVLGGAAAKKAGGSTRAGFAALIGGLAGAFFFGLPLPIVGTIIGACLGAFGGALLAELTVQGDALHSARVGYAAAVGRLLGILSKLGVGMVLLVVSAIAAAPWGATRPSEVVTTQSVGVPAATQAAGGPATAP